MPIYDYRCRNCEKSFETLVRGNRTPACPECGSENLEKLLSVPAPPVTHSNPEPCQPGGCGACRFN